MIVFTLTKPLHKTATSFPAKMKQTFVIKNRASNMTLTHIIAEKF